MNINTNLKTYNLNTPIKTNCGLSFYGNLPVETIKHYNLGIMADGFIGKVKVLTADKVEAFLNVFKRSIAFGEENYRLIDDMDNIIGEMNIKINKYNDYDRLTYPSDPSHIFVDELRNYSRPATPYHNPNLDEFKHIGVRLMQIAQRRSDECRCAGNIKLVSKNESKLWYKNIIGMREEFPEIPGQSKFMKMLHNPNVMYLPPENKEPLSRLYGGL